MSEQGESPLLQGRGKSGSVGGATILPIYDTTTQADIEDVLTQQFVGRIRCRDRKRFRRCIYNSTGRLDTGQGPGVWWPLG